MADVYNVLKATISIVRIYVRLFLQAVLDSIHKMVDAKAAMLVIVWTLKEYA